MGPPSPHLRSASRTHARLRRLVCAAALQISKINCDDVLDDPYELLIAKLKAAPRPLCIHFLGVQPPIAAGALTAAAAPVTIQLDNLMGGHDAAGRGGAPPPAAAPPAANGGALFGLL